MSDEHERALARNCNPESSAVFVNEAVERIVGVTRELARQAWHHPFDTFSEWWQDTGEPAARLTAVEALALPPGQHVVGLAEQTVISAAVALVDADRYGAIGSYAEANMALGRAVDAMQAVQS